MIFTGHFGRIRHYRERGLITVSIAKTAPLWYEDLTYYPLVPSTEFKSYKEQLQSLSKEEVLEDLLALGGDVVLLGTAKPLEKCHRHQIASWFEERLEEI